MYNPGLCLKVHEMDDILLEALCHKFEALDVNRTPEEKTEMPVLPELLICDALRHNLIVRENSDGEATGDYNRDEAQRSGHTLEYGCCGVRGDCV